MAEAPGHRLGQIIGDALELAVEPMLRSFAEEYDLYLDKKGPRPVRPGLKCTWVDNLGNAHDLDFVLERGGTPTKIGKPAAFVETAWRRYTKHSRAKAQEIQGAILPLLATHSNVMPFAGTVVAGRWTAGALQQIRSSGLSVLHIEYKEIVDVFTAAGVDIDSEEATPDAYLQEQVDAWLALTGDEKGAVGEALRACASERFASFRQDLAGAISRLVQRVTVLPLHSVAVECASVTEAIAMIVSYVPPAMTPQLVRFEVIIRYTNGDRIDAQFGSAIGAMDFLRTFAT
ncbi:MAG: DNA methylase [Acidimicrobiales bacterium]